MRWDERISYVYDIKRVEDENHVHIKCAVYTHIRAQFQNILHNADLPKNLIHSNYGDLGFLFLKFFIA